MIDGLVGCLLICGLPVLIPLISIKAVAAMKKKGRGRTIQPAVERQPDIQTEVKEAVGNMDENSGFMKLAELCKMGDIIAMIDMAYYFREQCPEPLRNLFEAYERWPLKENEDGLNAYLTGHPKEKQAAESYMMWLVRAAFYGNEEASQQVERCPYYKRKSYIPYAMLTGEGSSSIKFWDSDSLREMGLTDMARGCTDCSLIIDRRRGCFDLCYVADYVPFDEDGFGAEWDYEDIYYDEFFCCMTVKSEEEIPGQLAVLDAERETYWINPVHDAANRKYRRRL